MGVMTGQTALDWKTKRMPATNAVCGVAGQAEPFILCLKQLQGI